MDCVAGRCWLFVDGGIVLCNVWLKVRVGRLLAFAGVESRMKKSKGNCLRNVRNDVLARITKLQMHLQREWELAFLDWLVRSSI